jgi:hypothetical protein
MTARAELPKNVRQYKPAGPVAASFLRDQVSDVRAILGPVGGGKSSTCVFDLIRSACLMPEVNDPPPPGVDGVIRFKVAVIGQTYGQMERNLFPTWKRWLPADGANWTEADFTGGGGRQAIHKIEWDIPRGNRRVRVFFEAVFAALGEHVVEDFMRGFEPTCFWFYEVDLLPESCIPQAILRLGRYPAVGDLKPSTPLRGFPGFTRGRLPEGKTYEQLPPNTLYRSFIICDLNAPDVDSWFYKLFEEDCPPGFKLYKQPSGLSPQAENIANLPPGYYQRQITVLRDKHLIQRMVHAQYAPSRDGEPVFPEYQDELFYAGENIVPYEGVDIELGLDGGLGNPAAVFNQVLPNGQFVTLAEVVPGRMSAKRFAAEVKRELAELSVLAGRPLRIARGYADPATFNGADKEDGELAWAEQVSLALEIPIEPAPSNEITLRLDAVRDEMVIEGGIPRTRISRRCKKLRKAYASHYCYKIDKATGKTAAEAKPHKNEYSHVADADQYHKLGKKGRYGVIGQAGAKSGPGTERRLPGAVAQQNRTVVVKSSFLSGR